MICKDAVEKDIWLKDIQKQLQENKGKIAPSVGSVFNDSTQEYYEVWGDT